VTHIIAPSCARNRDVQNGRRRTTRWAAPIAYNGEPLCTAGVASRLNRNPLQRTLHTRPRLLGRSLPGPVEERLPWGGVGTGRWGGRAAIQHGSHVGSLRLRCRPSDLHNRRRAEPWRSRLHRVAHLGPTSAQRAQPGLLPSRRPMASSAGKESNSVPLGTRTPGFTACGRSHRGTATAASWPYWCTPGEPTVSPPAACRWGTCGGPSASS